MKKDRLNLTFSGSCFNQIRFIAFAAFTFVCLFGPDSSIIGQTDQGQPHLMVEKMPLFNGKDAGTFSTWAEKEIKYPAEALKQKITGKVYVSFVVERDGTVSSVKVIKGVPTLNEEAVRVVKSSPKWTPGEANNVPVRVKFTLPVEFKTTFPSDAKLKESQ